MTKPLDLKRDQGSRRIATPLELCADQVSCGEHVFLGVHAGEWLCASGESVGMKPREPVLEDDFGDVRPGKALVERRAAASPGRALGDAGAVDAQLDVLVAAVKPQRKAGW
ncbi:hypothetical protein WME90_27365 [Sorangium sp. So ce375]|uniref:hypothetical protein n=1 Tax=Sorangium sp. So ce375 TaxID=3133306 RepID=UPI003F5BE260